MASAITESTTNDLNLTFHFSLTNSLGGPPVNEEFVFDAEIQIEWDCLDEHTNAIMENDLDVRNHMALVTKNLTWMAKVRAIATEKLRWPHMTPFYVDLHKIMDGLAICYVAAETPENIFVSVTQKRYHMFVNAHNYIHTFFVTPFTKKVIAIPVTCVHNERAYETQNTISLRSDSCGFETKDIL